MKRRELLAGGLVAAALSPAGGGARSAPGQQTNAPKKGRFKLNYAPSFGQFRNHAGNDLIAQIQFAADEGFGAMFDNGMMGRPHAEQELIARELAKRDMILGPFVLYADFKAKSYVTRDKEVRTMLLKLMRQGIETSKRVDCRWALVAPGRWPAHPAKSSTTCTTSRSPRATSSPTSRWPGTSWPHSTSATTRAGRNRPRERSTTRKYLNTSIKKDSRAPWAWSTGTAWKASKASGP